MKMRKVCAVLLAALLLLQNTSMLSLHMPAALADFATPGEASYDDSYVVWGGEDEYSDSFDLPEEEFTGDLGEYEELDEDKTDAIYAYIDRDMYLYKDKERDVKLGYAADRTAVLVKQIRTYANGGLYEAIFDTNKTAGNGKWETGYFYTANLDQLTDEEVERIDGIRIVGGEKVTYVRFYYMEEDDPEKGDRPYINDNAVNLRRKPNKKADYITHLEEGTPVHVIGKTHDKAGNEWYKISCEQGTGFVMAKFVSGVGGAKTLEAEPEDEETEETEVTEETANTEETETTEETEETTDIPAAVTGDDEDDVFGETENTDETATDETVTDETATDETATDETVTDETATDETETDETLIEETETDETATEETETTDETLTEATPGEATAEKTTTAKKPVKKQQEATPGEATPEDAIIDLLDIDQTNPDRQVSIDVSWGEGKLVFGDTVTMSMQLSGYEGLEYSVFWQCDKGAGFETVAELDGAESFDLIVDEENAGWIWRAGVNAQVVRTDAMMTETEADDEFAAEEGEEAAEPVEEIAKKEDDATGEAEGEDEAAE